MKKYIEAIASREGRDPSEIYAEIQSAINYAWENADQNTGRAQLGLIGSRGVPSPEELIAAIEDRIKRYGK